MIEIIKKKSTDFTDTDIEELYKLFETVFHKKRSISEFKNQFLNTSLGYSFHALAKDNDLVVGHNVYIPFRYLKDNEPFLLCLSVDAMLHPDYRGKGLYRKMLSACEDMARSEGCRMRIGFPNDNSYPVQINGFKYNDVGKLDTYCLPVNIGGFNRKFEFLEPLARLASKSVVALSKCSKSTKGKPYKFRKDIYDFNSFRYKWFDSDYNILELDDVHVVYKDSIFKDKKATFIMDVYPMTKRNFDLAVREVYNRTKSYTPIILYVGNLPFTPLSMIRVPHKFEPKHFHFVTKIFDSDFIGPESLEIANWDLNLSNYDLL